MNSRELIEQWNENIPFKIRESDLNCPSSDFVVKALLGLLGAMNIQDKWSLMIFNENKNTTQIGKANLSQFIDGLYKISNPNNSFRYIDMIQPVPKKISRVLQILLNDLFYYKMVKEEIKEPTEPLIKAFGELQTELNTIILTIEKNKIRAEKAETQIKQCKEDLITMQKQAIELEQELGAVEIAVSKCIHLAEENANEIRRITETFEQVRNLHVDNVEAKNLVALNSELDNKSTSLKEMEHALNVKMFEESRKIKEIHDLVQGIKKMMENTQNRINEIHKYQKELQEKQKEIDEIHAGIKDTEEKMKSECAANKESKLLHGLSQRELRAKLRQLKENVTSMKEDLHVQALEEEKTLFALRKNDKYISDRKQQLENVIALGSSVLKKIKSLRL